MHIHEKLSACLEGGDLIVESRARLLVSSCKFHLFEEANFRGVCNCRCGHNGVVFCLSVLENCCHSN